MDAAPAIQPYRSIILSRVLARTGGGSYLSRLKHPDASLWFPDRRIAEDSAPDAVTWAVTGDVCARSKGRSPRICGRFFTRTLIMASLLAVALILTWPVADVLNPVVGDRQRGLDFASRQCGECHSVTIHASIDGPELGEPPTFRWIARNHPRYMDGFLLRPSRQHPLVTGRDAADLRALFVELGHVR